MVTIMSSAGQSNISPFWEEQQKYLKSSSTGIRYHPIIIRYCLSFPAKTSAIYDEIRYDETNGTGFLILPSCRRLRDSKTSFTRITSNQNEDLIQTLCVNYDRK